ncbi:intein [Pseudonocardia endophytica]|uniref:Intein n=1 Tax=Pseudonocardia endophytica TaxID=401976 RepID=A0A4R1HPU9_PSEEN|nr:intein [Pseudonocardia endophytica]
MRDEGIGGDAALPGMRGLLRSVRTPEFVGTVFHEVEARSALNRVPSTSPMPFGWTVNPYRGCSHACVYCLDGATPVTLADGSTRPIADLREGDEVLGTEPDGAGGRRYVRTPVLAHWSTRRRAHRLTLDDGVVLVTSDEHRFLTDEGWRHVTPGWCRSGRRPHLRPGTALQGPGRAAVASGGAASREGYREGYVCGLVRADAARSRVTAEPFPSDWVELEALARVHHLLAGLRTAATDRTGSGRGADSAGPTGRAELAAAGHTGAEPAGTDRVVAEHAGLARADAARAGAMGAGAGRSAVARSGLPQTGIAHAVAAPTGAAQGGSVTAAATAWPDHPTPGWSAGFLAGVLDACGEVGPRGVVLVPVGRDLARRTLDELRRNGFGVVAEPARTADAVRLCVRGGAAEHLRLIALADPAVGRVRDVSGAALSAPPCGAPRVVSVEALGVEQPMYDITTGTGDFLAAGVVSHNCFARNTHTYLDLDAGEDFDSQIVVKVNVARVLERELARRSWRREHVAMGTNTDPYQRAEGRYRLMPGVIGALGRSGTPFSILTKGTVLTRDLPDLTAAAGDVPVGVGVSIALVDRSLQSHLEPGTPSPAARLDMVRKITGAGLTCGVMVAPVLPLLTDSDEALDAVLGEVAAAGASGATVIALHLRPGTREWFLRWLAREYPALVPRYERLYRRGAYADPEYRKLLARRVAPLLSRHGLDRPFPTPRTTSGAVEAPRDPKEGQMSLI